MSQLSPAECELIRECQERAFSGLEVQQLKAQAAAHKEKALRKQQEERTCKEAASRQVADEAMRKTGTRSQEISAAATVVRIAVRRTEEAPQMAEEIPPAGCSPAAVLQLDAFAAPPSVAANSSKASTAADIAAESFSAAKRLLQEMRPQGFQVPKAILVKPAAPEQLEPANNPEDASCRETETVDPQPNAAHGSVSGLETDTASSSQENSLTTAFCSLSQFVFKCEEADKEAQQEARKTGRKDVVTRTRFAHRTKLLFASKRAVPPFPSLAATATARTIDAANGTPPKTLVAANTRSVEAEPQGKRKSVSFLRADDADDSSAFMNVRFAHKEPKRHKLL